MGYYECTPCIFKVNMKLSDQTIKILKNMAEIETSLMFQPGSRISNTSEHKDIFVEADVEEDFPKEFGIYNLSPTC